MDLAEEMYAECLSVGQSARAVSEPLRRNTLRADLRRLARGDGVRVRTADREGVVLLARLDAAIWRDDTQAMRAKLTPLGELG